MSYVGTDHPILVVESVPFGDLREHLREMRESSLDMNIVGHNNFTLTMDLVGFGAQVARGMAYLSSMRVSKGTSILSINSLYVKQ